jgi:hypothetical protein
MPSVHPDAERIDFQTRHQARGVLGDNLNPKLGLELQSGSERRIDKTGLTAGVDQEPVRPLRSDKNVGEDRRGFCIDKTG